MKYSKISSTRVINLNINENSYLYFVSDIHGDYSLFKVFIEKINLKKDDYLFIIGDIIEKGKENLKILDYMISLRENNKNIYCTSGNCDEIFRFLVPPIDKDKFFYYAIEKKNSIINEMAIRLDYHITDNMDVDEFGYLCIEKFFKYYDFLNSLPSIITINNKIRLVHAGLLDEENIPCNALDSLKIDNFLSYNIKNSKLLIVGHYPTINYRLDKPCLNPYFDLKRNIISIDGGNNVIMGGQINYISLCPSDVNKCNSSYVDHYKKYIVLSDYYNYENNSFNIPYGKYYVDKIREDGNFYYLNIKVMNRCLYVLASHVYKDDKGLYILSGFCNSFSLSKGDIISMISNDYPFSIIKKDGILGLVQTKCLELEEYYDKM